MDKNTKYLLPQWALVLLLAGIMIFGMVAAILRGQYVAPLAVGVALASAALYVWYSRRKALSLFHDTTADRVIAHYRSTLQKLPNGDALSSYTCAVALALYGECDRARDELSRVNWSILPPLYEGLRCHVLAILAVVQERNYRKARELAEESRDLCIASARLPGSKQSSKATEAMLDACRLLEGSEKEPAISRLEASVKSLPPLGLVIPAWSLASYYRKIGNQAQAEEFESRIRSVLPHFVLLKR